MAQGESLTLSKGGSLHLDKTNEHYDKGKMAGELGAKDSTVSFDECRETKTAQVNLNNTKRYGRTLRSQATASYANNSELSVDAVKLGKHSQTKMNNTTAQGESLKLSTGSKVQLDETSIHYQQGTIAGNLQANKVDNLQINHCKETVTADITCADTMRRGKTLLSKARSSYKRSYMDVEESIKYRSGSTLSVDNAGFKSRKIVDSSTLKIANEASFETNDYKHKGNAKSDKNSPNSHLIVTSKRATLRGKGQVRNISLDVDHLKEKTDFITGKNDGKNYTIDKSLQLITKDKVRIKQRNERNCDVAVKADKILVKNHFKTSGNVQLQSTKGDIKVDGKIAAKNIHLKSKDDVTIKGEVKAKKSAVITAKKTFHNTGGKVKAYDKVYVKAKDIKNKEAGKIAGDNAVILQAKNKIYNVCKTKEYHGKYGKKKSFQASTITGGTGKETNGYGVIMQARKIRNDASDIITIGNNYLDGKEGVKFKARQHSYVKRKETKRKKFLGMTVSKKRKVDVVTRVQGSQTISLTGRNVIRSKRGRISATVAHFLTKKGTDLHSRHKVRLTSLITKNKSYRSKSSLFGLHKVKSKVRYQVSNPTFIHDNGLTTIYSEKGDVDMKGTVIVGNGNLKIKAGKHIRIRRDKLNHQIKEKSRKVGVSVFGMNAIRAAKRGGDVIGVLAAEDPTIAKMQKLAQSQDKLAAGANLANLGINVYNTVDSLQASNVDKAMLARYGLGGAQGFDPRIAVTATETSSKRKFQTLGSGGIARENISMQAGKGIELSDGVTVHATQDINIDTPKLAIYASKLRSYSKQKQKSIGAGVTATGEIVDVSVGKGKTKSRSTQYINSTLSAGGHINLGKVEDVTLRGGSIQI